MRTPSIRGLIGTTVLTGCLIVAPAQAHADPAAATTETVTQSATPDDGYWTTERMAHAIPAETPATGTARVVRTPSPPAPPALLAEPSQPDSPATDSGSAAQGTRVVGKVFYHNPRDNKDYACSGSVLNSPSRNLVATAGHCVHGGSGGTFMTKWMFAPGYTPSGAPDGFWAAKHLTAFNQWIDNGNVEWDLGFANVFPLSGRQVADVVGSNGLLINQPKRVEVTLLAYPGPPQFPGDQQYSCHGFTYAHGFKQIGFDCTLSPGASGGPFLMNYNGTFGNLNGVISNGPIDKNYSPYFDNDVGALYDKVKNLT